MTQQYDSYKPSGINWIGDIPSHWEKCRIKQHYYLKGRIGWQGLKADEFIEYGPYLVTGTDFRNGRVNWSLCYHISEERYNEAPEIHVEIGDILITKDGTVGKLALIEDKPEKVSLNSHLLIIRPLKHNLRNRFLYYVLESNVFKNYTEYQQSGSIMASLSQEKIGEFCYYLPPVNEQEAIAAWLDEKCQAIDAAIAKVDREIELIDELKQSEISRVVTRGLNPDAPLRPSGIDWIGDIPSHWKCIKIKHLSPVLRGASPRPIDDPKYFDENGEFSWVRIADVTASERYLEITSQRLSTLGATLSVKRYPGDLFLSIAGTVGKPIITRIKCCIHDGFVWFPLLKINPEYLYYVFMTGQPYRGLGKFGTQLNLNTDTVGNIFIPLPPSSEIGLIVRFLDKRCAEIDALKAKLSKKRETLTELRQSIISEVVTGKQKVI